MTPDPLPPVLLGAFSWLQNPPLHQCPVCSQQIEDGQPVIVVVVHHACEPVIRGLGTRQPKKGDDK
jgi:hypothetical protein